jgi:hypothetical protein
MVMNLQDSCSNHHPTTTRGFLRTVNWNLKGAQKCVCFVGISQNKITHEESNLPAALLEVVLLSAIKSPTEKNRNTREKSRMTAQSLSQPGGANFTLPPGSWSAPH